MNLEGELNKLETTLNFLYSKMNLLVNDDEAINHQMAYLPEEIDLTKMNLLEIEMKIFQSTLSNKEDESIH